MESTQVLECTQILDSQPSLHQFERRNEIPVKVATLTIDGADYAIWNTENRIGRDAKCNIVLNSKAVSVEHCVIEADLAGGHFISDLGSTNKTRLGDVQLKPFVKYYIKDGDLLKLANLKGVYRHEKISTDTIADGDKTQMMSEMTAIPGTPERKDDEEVMAIVVAETPHKDEANSAGDISDGDIFGEIDSSSMFVRPLKSQSVGGSSRDNMVDVLDSCSKDVSVYAAASQSITAADQSVEQDVVDESTICEGNSSDLVAGSQPMFTPEKGFMDPKLYDCDTEQPEPINFDELTEPPQRCNQWENIDDSINEISNQMDTIDSLVKKNEIQITFTPPKVKHETESREVHSDAAPPPATTENLPKEANEWENLDDTIDEISQQMDCIDSIVHKTELHVPPQNKTESSNFGKEISNLENSSPNTKFDDKEEVPGNPSSNIKKLVKSTVVRNLGGDGGIKDGVDDNKSSDIVIGAGNIYDLATQAIETENPQEGVSGPMPSVDDSTAFVPGEQEGLTKPGEDDVLDTDAVPMNYDAVGPRKVDIFSVATQQVEAGVASSEDSRDNELNPGATTTLEIVDTGGPNGDTSDDQVNPEIGEISISDLPTQAVPGLQSRCRFADSAAIPNCDISISEMATQAATAEVKCPASPAPEINKTDAPIGGAHGNNERPLILDETEEDPCENSISNMATQQVPIHGKEHDNNVSATLQSQEAISESKVASDPIGSANMNEQEILDGDDIYNVMTQLPIENSNSVVDESDPEVNAHVTLPSMETNVSVLPQPCTAEPDCAADISLSDLPTQATVPADQSPTDNFECNRKILMEQDTEDIFNVMTQMPATRNSSDLEAHQQSDQENQSDEVSLSDMMTQPAKPSLIREVPEADVSISDLPSQATAAESDETVQDPEEIYNIMTQLPVENKKLPLEDSGTRKLNTELNKNSKQTCDDYSKDQCASEFKTVDRSKSDEFQSKIPTSCKSQKDTAISVAKNTDIYDIETQIVGDDRSIESKSESQSKPPVEGCQSLNLNPSAVVTQGVKEREPDTCDGGTPASVPGVGGTRASVPGVGGTPASVPGVGGTPASVPGVGGTPASVPDTCDGGTPASVPGVAVNSKIGVADEFTKSSAAEPKENFAGLPQVPSSQDVDLSSVESRILALSGSQSLNLNPSAVVTQGVKEREPDTCDGGTPASVPGVAVNSKIGVADEFTKSSGAEPKENFAGLPQVPSSQDVDPSSVESRILALSDKNVNSFATQQNLVTSNTRSTVAELLETLEDTSSQVVHVKKKVRKLEYSDSDDSDSPAVRAMKKTKNMVLFDTQDTDSPLIAPKKPCLPLTEEDIEDDIDHEAQLELICNGKKCKDRSEPDGESAGVKFSSNGLVKDSSSDIVDVLEGNQIGTTDNSKGAQKDDLLPKKLITNNTAESELLLQLPTNASSDKLDASVPKSIADSVNDSLQLQVSVDTSLNQPSPSTTEKPAPVTPKKSGTSRSAATPTANTPSSRGVNEITKRSPETPEIPKDFFGSPIFHDTPVLRQYVNKKKLSLSTSLLKGPNAFSTPKSEVDSDFEMTLQSGVRSKVVAKPISPPVDVDCSVPKNVKVFRKASPVKRKSSEMEQNSQDSDFLSSQDSALGSQDFGRGKRKKTKKSFFGFDSNEDEDTFSVKPPGKTNDTQSKLPSQKCAPSISSGSGAKEDGKEIVSLRKDGEGSSKRHSLSEAESLSQKKVKLSTDTDIQSHRSVEDPNDLQQSKRLKDGAEASVNVKKFKKASPRKPASPVELNAENPCETSKLISETRRRSRRSETESGKDESPSSTTESDKEVPSSPSKTDSSTTRTGCSPIKSLRGRKRNDGRDLSTPDSQQLAKRNKMRDESSKGASEIAEDSQVEISIKNMSQRLQGAMQNNIKLMEDGKEQRLSMRGKNLRNRSCSTPDDVAGGKDGTPGVSEEAVFESSSIVNVASSSSMQEPSLQKEVKSKGRVGKSRNQTDEAVEVPKENELKISKPQRSVRARRGRVALTGDSVDETGTQAPSVAPVAKRGTRAKTAVNISKETEEDKSVVADQTESVAAAVEVTESEVVPVVKRGKKAKTAVNISKETDESVVADLSESVAAAGEVTVVPVVKRGKKAKTAVNISKETEEAGVADLAESVAAAGEVTESGVVPVVKRGKKAKTAVNISKETEESVVADLSESVAAAGEVETVPVVKRGRRANIKVSVHEKTVEPELSDSQDSLLMSKTKRGRGRVTPAVLVDSQTDSLTDSQLDNSQGRRSGRARKKKETFDEIMARKEEELKQKKLQRSSGLSSAESSRSVSRASVASSSADVPPVARGRVRSKKADLVASTPTPSPAEEPSFSVPSSPAASTSRRKLPRTNSMSSELSEDSLSSSKKQSLQSVSSLPMKVMFTGLADAKLSAMVKKLGGKVVEKPSDCSVLVTDKVRRTVKFLCALGLGKPIVSPNWLSKSKAFNQFTDPFESLLSDSEAEDKFNFQLKSSLEIARNSRLLEGYSFYSTPSVLPPPAELKPIIECSGGTFLAKPPAKWPPNSAVISSLKDRPVWSKLTKHGVQPPILSTESLLSGVLQQQFDFSRHRLK